MKKLVSVALAIAGLSAGVAFADAESQAGSAWRNNADPVIVPGTPEYWGNSGWPPIDQIRSYGAAPYYYGYPAAGPQPHYPYAPRRFNPTRRDRDGDGVVNRYDRFPDDPYRS